MKIYIGADHRGFELKNKLIDWLKSEGHEVEDCGNKVYDPQDDYVDFATSVAKNLQQAMRQLNNETMGILLCGSGVGVSVAANRFKGVVCALGFDAGQIKHARENDHINCLSIPSDYINFEKAKTIVTAFITAKPKQDKKYFRRLDKLNN